MSHGLPNPETIFAQAIAIAAPKDRTAFLDRVCNEDTDLRREVDKLVSDHFRAGDFLEEPAIRLVATMDQSVTEGPGTLIGAYKLMEQIGEGGMGLVFVAEQQKPVRRKVALKVLKPGMDTRQVIARFEAERQALALMDHPNIARVLEAGATPSGRPYFVMELVKGVPMTEFCDDNRLTPRERLELFVSVCQAVQHAHQKGIIHRDVKPSNIMVTSHDGTPVVKVIDFGVAKAIGQQLTEKTLYTALTQMIGTPQYMSPEQAGMSSLDVDTRSDIYALGVLLYELLTGTTPFDARRLQTATYDEFRRIIREEEPPRPSTRIGTLERATTATGSGARSARHANDTALLETRYDLARIAAERQSDPARLRQLFRGELDWIVMKALEKDRNRRYATANALAADVQRYLHDEPVQACPPSAWYKLRKFTRRHRLGFAVASTAALAVLLTLVGLGVSNVLIRQEQARTREEKDRAQQAQKLALDRAEEIQRGLKGLKAANAMLDRGRWYVSQRSWDDAHAAFTNAIRLRPDHVSAWFERSNLYAHLGLWDLAAADFAQDIELCEPDTTLRWFQHALLRLYVGDTEGYRQACRTMRERFRGTTRAAFAEELVRSHVLAPSSDADLPFLLELSQEVAARQPWSSISLYILGTAHYRAGQDEQAIQRLREALAATDWNSRLLSYPVLAMAYHRLGRAAEAREALDEAARVLDQWIQGRYPSPEQYWVMHLGADAVWPVTWWDWLGYQLSYREAKLLIDGAPPMDDPRLHVLRARSLAGLRWNAKAQVEYAEALKLRPDDQQIQLEAHRNRGYYCVGARQWAEAAAEFAKASEIQPDDSYLWRFRAVACLAAGDMPAYRQACAAMLDRFEKTEDPEAAGNVLLVCVLMDDAVTDMARLLPLTHSSDRMWHWGAWVRGAALYRAGSYEEAVQCFEKAARLSRPSAWDWCFLAMAHHRLGHAAQARRCLTEAGRWIDEANRREEDDLSGTQPAWGGWHEPVVIPLLLREAKALLAEKETKN